MSIRHTTKQVAAAADDDGPRRSKRAVIYLRVSTQRQADTGYDENGFSINEQHEVCQAKAAQLDAEVIELYVDKAESARYADRPELIRMMDRIKTRKDVDYVIVHKLDRFSRDRFDEAMLQYELRKAGVKFISATENINGDTPGDRALHGFLAVFADYYSANLGHEIKKGLRQKFKAGGTSGAARLGYLNTRVQVGHKEIPSIGLDPERAPLISWAFEAFATGDWTLRTITAELRKRGLTTRETTKSPSHPVHDSHVHRILTNRYYLGLVTYEGVERQGNHPPLTDQATFDRVQAILHARNQVGEKPQKHVHYLKGMLACARCSGRFGITTPTNRHGTTYEYFYCLNRQKRGKCEQRFAPHDKIEKEVELFWKTVVFPQVDIDALRADLTAKIDAELGQTSKQVPTQQRRIAKLERERKKLLQAFYADAIPEDLLRSEQTRITREIAQAEKMISDQDISRDRAYQLLEELLTLADNPYALYLCADEPTRRLLNQAVVVRFWIWDERIHTVEFTPEFAALQQIAKTQQQTSTHETPPDLADLARHLQGNQDNSGSARPTKGYARTTGNLCTPLSRYLKTIQLQPAMATATAGTNPASGTTNPRTMAGGGGLNLVTLVELLVAYSKRLDLVSSLVSAVERLRGAEGGGVRSVGCERSPRVWRVRDRLSAADVQHLVSCYRDGVAVRELAGRFKISPSSVKRLLRERQVRRSGAV